MTIDTPKNNQGKYAFVLHHSARILAYDTPLVSRHMFASSREAFHAALELAGLLNHIEEGAKKP